MSLDTTQTEEDILNVIRGVIPRVYVTEVPAGESPQYPFVVVYFAVPIRSARGRHITSTRNDLMVGYFTVQVASLDDASARVIMNRIRGALLGYRPFDSGEIVSNGGLSYSRAATQARPMVYYREAGYSYPTNTTGA